MSTDRWNELFKRSREGILKYPEITSTSNNSIEKCSDNRKLLEGISYFFCVLEGQKVPVEIKDFEEKELKEILIRIARELLNRDYIKYITTGIWGESCETLLKILS
jgi:hypothetical protein